MQPLDGPIHIAVRYGGKERCLTSGEVVSRIHVDQPIGAVPRWDAEDVEAALKHLPIKAIGHNGRDRLQFNTIRPLDEREWRWLAGAGARVFLLDETTYVLRW
jgi:hypothetical protein